MKDSTPNRSTIAASGRISIFLLVVATIFACAILLSRGTTATSQESTCTPLPANLIAWYRAEDNANDSFGTNHGTLRNGATFAAGKVGRAFSFDGDNGMVDVPFNSALNVASAVTIEAWVKTTSTVTGDHKLLAGRPGNYQLAKLDDGRPGFAVVIGGQFINAFSSTTLAANTLTHVAGTYDASTGLVNIYVDGSLTGTTVTAGNPDAGAQPFQIGGFGGTFVSNQFINNFGGAIDEVSLYNRALSASEIQSIFDANDAGKCVPCTPLPSNGVSWHRAENDANDSVGSNNGTLQNGAAFAAGKVGQAFNLDGTNDYVDIGDLAELDNATELTVMAWIKRQNAGNSDGAIVGKWRDRSTADNSFLLILGGGGFAQNVGAFIIEFDNNSDGFLQDDTVIPIDTWTFLAATWRNSDGALKLYKNGIEKGSTTAGVGRRLRIHPAAFTAKIGEWGISPVSSTSPSFPGQIDEPAIFNRALTAAEILAIYDGDSAGMCLPVCTPPPSNLVSWYPGEGNANDQQGNNNGTLQNGATFAPGKVGQAFSFDGVNDSVDIANTTSLDFGAGNFSIEFWANLNSLSTDQMLFHKISGTGASFNDPSYFVEFDQPNALRFRIGEAFLSNSNDLIVPTSLTAGQWFHVAAVRNGDLTQIYLNGVLAGSQTSGSNINTGTGGDAAIGRCLTSDAGCARFVNGKIDEVSLYNRALSASEIQAIYDADSAGICLPTCTPPPSNLESWYRGEGDANDFQGTNHGTLVNGAGFATAVVNQGFNLDGVNDFVRIGNPTALNFGTGDFSVQTWVKTSFRGGSFNDYIISKSNVGNDAQFVLSYNAGGTGFPSFLMSDGTTNSLASGTANLADGIFHHLAGVREGTTLRLYVDGVQVGTATTPSLVNATSANNVVIGGRDNPDFDPYFNGIIDEVQFFNRALSASEIQAVFNAGSAGMCTSTPLQISPTTQTVNIGGTVNFSATGGTAPYTFSLLVDNSMADINLATGVYTAGTLVGTDTVRVTDALGATSDATVNVSSGAATRLAFLVQPMNAIAGQSISPALQVAIQDNAGNTVRNATDPVTIAIGNNPGASTLSGNVTRDAVNGIATFNDLSLNRSGTGYELVASSGSFASATSLGFIVDPGVASQLVFTVQPSNAKRSAIITPAIQVEVRDANGNPVTNSLSSVVLALGNNPGGGTLQGSSVQPTINGIATFADLRIAGGAGGHGYTLNATSAGLPPTTSSPFNIFGPTQLAFTVQPSNAKRSTIIAPAVEVQVQDENGDVVTDTEYSIGIFPGSLPGFGSLQGVLNKFTTNGVARFNDLRIVGGSGGHGYTLQAFTSVLPVMTSNPFNIFGPAQLAFTVQPSNAKRSAIIAPAVEVQVQDENGDVVTDTEYSIGIFPGSLPGFGSLQGVLNKFTTNGVARFNDLRIVGGFGGHGYTLQAFTSGLPVMTSNPFNIFGPTQLAFTVQPSNTIREAIISPPIQVEVRDENHDVVTDLAYFISVGQHFFPGGGSLQGNTPRQTVNGVAAFDDLKIVGGVGGPDYRLAAQTVGLPIGISNGISNPFEILPPPFEVTNTNDSGAGSLRQAILNANNAIGATISFNIPGAGPHTISPLTELPGTGLPVMIDGTTQPGFAGSPIIELNGANAGPNSSGLWIRADDSTVKGLVINRFGVVGIKLWGPRTTIQGNHIGTDITGTVALPNGNGIQVYSDNNLIGGAQPGEGNTIAFNSATGVSIGVSQNQVRDNQVRGNSIHSNGLLGIDLGPTGVNTNDFCDHDTGANRRQNFPDLNAVSLVGNSTKFEGRLHGKPNETYTLDFFSCPSCDAAGYGEGQFYLGSGSVTTGAACSSLGSPFDITLPVTFVAGHQITATATDQNGNTSEFSPCFGPSANIEGTLLDSGNQPLRGVKVQVENLPLGSGNSFPLTVTGANGRFKFRNLALGRDYRVTPDPRHYSFAPANRNYLRLTTNQDDVYRGTFTGFQLSGFVALNSYTLNGVTMTLTGPVDQRTSTDNGGNFYFNNLPAGTYTLTPSKTGYVFTPSTFNVTSDRTENFTATADAPGLLGRIVFGDSDGIKAMNADGSGLVTLVTGNVRQPDLSADGRKIVFVKEHGNGSYSIRTMNADGSGETQIISHSSVLASPAWSHDRTKIAFIKSVFGPRQVFVMNADGSNEVRVTTDSNHYHNPEWSPDGTRLALYKDGLIPGWNYRAYVILGTTFPDFVQTFPDFSGDGKFPKWSPDGTKIAFIKQVSSSSPSTLDESIVVMNAADYSGPTPIVSVSVSGSGIKLVDLEWSPDSTRLIYRKSFIFSSTLHLILSDGTGDTQLNLPGVDSWSIDSRVPTPAGANVKVQSGRVSITFPTTSGANKTTTITPIDPASAGTTPGGFRLGNMAYEISTTASFTPPVEVCFTVSANSYPLPQTFAPLIIFHNENGVLLPQPPTLKDFPSRTICAEVNSFSPFALGEQVDETLPSISGLVVDQNGNPLHDIAIALSGDEERFTTTGQDGSFHFVNLVQDGNYLIQPTEVGYLYDFPYQSYIGLTGEETIVFTATPANFGISGRVLDQGGNPLANVRLTLEGASVFETTTDAGGNYTFTGLSANSSFSIAPLQSGLFFTPSQVSIQSLQDNLSEINFLSGPPPPNQSPNAANDVATTNQNTPVTIVVLANDSDADGDTLTVTNTTQGGTGAVAINVGNTMTYSPNAGFTGPDSFTYTISDGRGGSASATVNVTVLQVNRPPTVIVQNLTRNADANCQAVVTAQEVGGGSSDPDGDAITLSMTPGGPFAVGARTVTVTVTDSHGASASANATVTVVDITPPAITCPSNIVAIAAPGQSSAAVNYSTTATDNCSNTSITATHSSGSSFPVGVTTVTVTATDAAGTAASCSFTVTVNSSTAPPDKIAFDSTRDGNLEIYSMNADGTNQTRLTSNSALDFKPTWSPDRSKIAFTSSRTGNGDIYVMNANGTNQTRLTTNSAIEDDASWSPDGTKIAFWSNRDGNPEIYVMNANGTNQTRLTSHSAWDTQPKWSPDGTRLAFVSNRNGVLNFDIYVMNANGSQVTRLTTNVSVDESPDWSPDGSKIVFTSNRSNLLDFEIWVMNANGSSQTRLTTSTRSSVRPAWSRDGAQITFATNRLALLNFEIYSMNANGTNQTRLTNNSALDFNPDR